MAEVDKAGEEQGELILTALVRSGRLVVGQWGAQRRKRPPR